VLTITMGYGAFALNWGLSHAVVYNMAFQREVRAEKVKNPVKLNNVVVDATKRQIPKTLQKKLKDVPNTIRGGHLVTAILKDGRRIQNVFVARRTELLGIYDQEKLTFAAEDIIDLEPTDLTHPPDFTDKNWLRFDTQPNS